MCPCLWKRNALVIRNSVRLSQVHARNSANCRSLCQASEETPMVRCLHGDAGEGSYQLLAGTPSHHADGRPNWPVTCNKKQSSYPALPGGSRVLATACCAASGLPPAAEDRHQLLRLSGGPPAGRTRVSTRKTTLSVQRPRCESLRLTGCVPFSKQLSLQVQETRVPPKHICIFSVFTGSAENVYF